MGIAVPGVSDPARFWHELLQGDERLNAEGIPCLSARDPRRTLTPRRTAGGPPRPAAWPPGAARDTDDAEDLDGGSRPERRDSPAVADCGSVRWRRPAGSGLGGAVVPCARRQALNRWSDLAAVAKAGCWAASSPARPSPASGLQGTYAFMFRRTTSARRAVRVGVVLGIAASSFLSFGFHREQRCGRTCCSVSAP